MPDSHATELHLFDLCHDQMIAELNFLTEQPTGVQVAKDLRDQGSVISESN
jgi:hypothetical protein